MCITTVARIAVVDAKGRLTTPSLYRWAQIREKAKDNGSLTAISWNLGVIWVSFCSVHQGLFYSLPTLIGQIKQKL